MATIEKNPPTPAKDLDVFEKSIDFALPPGFIDFYRTSNGAEISTSRQYVQLWAITEMISLNQGYNIDLYAPEFFMFGSDGGDTTYAIERSSGDIYEMPFIGMSKEEAIFICSTFGDFIGYFQ